MSRAMRARSSKRASSVLASTRARVPLMPAHYAESGEGDDRDADGERVVETCGQAVVPRRVRGREENGTEGQDDDDRP